MTQSSTHVKSAIIDFKLLAITLLFTLPVPAVSWITANGIQSNINSKYESAVVETILKEKGVDIRKDPEVMAELSLSNRCADYTETSSALKRICSKHSDLNSLATFSIVTIVLTFLAIFGMTLAGFIGRLNRFLLLVLFRAGLWVAQITVAGLVLANAGLAIATIYWIESWFIGRIHVGLIVALGIGAGLVSLRISIAAFRFFRRTEARVFGKRLGRVDYPMIWNFVETIAKETGTSPPNHIVVGLDPTFFVTEANVVCLDGKLKGRTLFLSLPFCRVLHKKELAAIIGHEFGHFVGLDTQFSRWFYPIYRGALETTDTLSKNVGGDDNGLQSIAFLPSLSLMNYFLSAFSLAERESSRERELAADRIGAMVAGTNFMASGLVKVHAFDQVWAFTQKKMAAALQEGKQLVNASEYFSAVVSAVSPDVFKDDLAASHTTHPTDSHPTLALRLASLEVDLEPMLDSALKSADEGQRAIEIVDRYDLLETELSDLEHYKLVRSGAVSAKSESSAESTETAEEARKESA